VAQSFPAKKAQVKGLLAGTSSTRTRRSQIPSVAQSFSGKEAQVKGLLAGTSSTRTRRSQIPSVAQSFPAKKAQVKGLLAGTSSTRTRRSQIPSVVQPIPAKKLRSRVYWQEHPALAQGARKSLRWLNQFRQRTSGQGFTGRNIQHSHRALANPFGGSTNSGKEAQVKGLLDAVDMTQYTLQGCCF